MRVEEFDFNLPPELIALEPARPRDSARLLVVNAGATRPLIDQRIGDLPSWVRAGDAVVFNDTRVLPAALSGVRVRGELRAQIDLTLLKRAGEARWRALARPAKRLRTGDRIVLAEGNGACTLGAVEASVADKGAAGEVVLDFSLSGPYLDEALRLVGRPPLPPYITGKRAALASDAADYQTIYARHDGAVAAPTAGLHFTPSLMAALEARGASLHFVTLHVGAGTFLPVKAADTDAHVMHAEWGEVTGRTAAALNRARAAGGRIIAVGTTAARLLESTATPEGRVGAFRGETAIFITPGHRFRAVDALLTNFHLPRSTLFMLVSALCGLAEMRRAYAHGIGKGYRFYSFGDACLLFPASRTR